MRGGCSLKARSGQRHWRLRLGQTETTIEAQSRLSETKTEVRARATGRAVSGGSRRRQGWDSGHGGDELEASGLRWEGKE